jgi:hypothetical protein
MHICVIEMPSRSVSSPQMKIAHKHRRIACVEMGWDQNSRENANSSHQIATYLMPNNEDVLLTFQLHDHRF